MKANGLEKFGRTAGREFQVEQAMFRKLLAGGRNQA